MAQNQSRTKKAKKFRSGSSTSATRKPNPPAPSTTSTTLPVLRPSRSAWPETAASNSSTKPPPPEMKTYATQFLLKLNQTITVERGHSLICIPDRTTADYELSKLRDKLGANFIK